MKIFNIEMYVERNEYRALRARETLQSNNRPRNNLPLHFCDILYTSTIILPRIRHPLVVPLSFLRVRLPRNRGSRRARIAPEIIRMVPVEPATDFDEIMTSGLCATVCSHRRRHIRNDNGVVEWWKGRGGAGRATSCNVCRGPCSLSL